MTINTETIRDAAEVLDTLTSALAVDHPLRTQAAARAKSCVSGLYSAADHIEAQAAEIARLNAIQAWQPIETAPRDGTAILLGSSDGAWIAKYAPVYPSGYRPKNPWFSLMLNHDHMGRMPNTKPTHWMPLPAAPDALQETAHDR